MMDAIIEYSRYLTYYNKRKFVEITIFFRIVNKLAEESPSSKRSPLEDVGT